MLNVTIQNDGKIKFQSECSSTKEMRSNVNLLLAVVSSMEIDSYCDSKKPILLTGYEDEVTKAAKKFDSSECLKAYISKH